MDRQPVAVLGDPAQGVDVGDVELGVDALAEQVHGQGDDVDVAGALAVAEQRALDPVGAGHHAELGGGHRACRGRCGGAATARPSRGCGTLRMEPLDHVGVDVRRVHLDGGRQVHDQRPVGRRLDDVDHRLADLDGVVDLGAGEALGRVLVADVGAGQRVLQLAAQPGGVDGDLGDAGLVEPEHDPALQHRRRVVEVDDGPRATPAMRLVGALDQLVAGTGSAPGS